MAYDEGLAETLRAALDDLPGAVSERRMFGGLCFLLNGNMLCGVMRDGALFRVGKANQAAALDVPFTREMAFTGRPMGGIVECEVETVVDDALRDRLLALALDFVAGLPPK